MSNGIHCSGAIDAKWCWRQTKKNGQLCPGIVFSGWLRSTLADFRKRCKTDNKCCWITIVKGGMLIVEPIQFWFLKCGIVPAGWNHCALAWACPCPPPLSSPDSAGKTGRPIAMHLMPGSAHPQLQKENLAGGALQKTRWFGEIALREGRWTGDRQARVTFGVQLCNQHPHQEKNYKETKVKFLFLAINNTCVIMSTLSVYSKCKHLTSSVWILIAP